MEWSPASSWKARHPWHPTEGRHPEKFEDYRKINTAHHSEIGRLYSRRSCKRKSGENCVSLHLKSESGRTECGTVIGQNSTNPSPSSSLLSSSESDTSRSRKETLSPEGSQKPLMGARLLTGCKLIRPTGVLTSGIRRSRHGTWESVKLQELGTRKFYLHI